MADIKTTDQLYEVCSCLFKGVRVQVVRGDITKIVAHVIVNASNTRLQGGGGINGAIQNAAGPQLNIELAQLYRETSPGIRGEVGKAYISGSHNMQPRVKAIVHAIGPVYDPTKKIAVKNQLNMVYLQSLDAAARGKMINNMTIVFPAISTGIFGYPMAEAAVTAISAIFEWIEKSRNREKFERIVIIMFGDNDDNEPHIRKAFRDETEGLVVPRFDRGFGDT